MQNFSSAYSLAGIFEPASPVSTTGHVFARPVPFTWR